VIGFLLAVAILVLQLHFGVIQKSLAGLAIMSIAWPYLLLALVLTIAAMATAPVHLDNQRISQIKDVSGDKEKADARFSALLAENEALKQQPRRSRSQQIAYDQAKKELANCGEAGRKFIGALVHRDEVEHGELYRILNVNGMSDADWNATVTWFRQTPGLVMDIPPTPFKPHQYWRVNPHYREALVELLLEK
jgi:hypothetical protein